MAPRRGGGGGGGGGGGSNIHCDDPFGVSQYGNLSNYRNAAIANFASYCLFFLITLGITIALCSVWKRNRNGKRLAGPFYIVSLAISLLYAFPVRDTHDLAN